MVVVEQNIARASNTHLGQRVSVRTAAGDVPFTVVGIVSDQQMNGTVLFTPLTTMQSVLHTPGAVNEYWIQTTSGNHQLIDQTNTRSSTHSPPTGCRCQPNASTSARPTTAPPTAASPPRSPCSAC